MKVDENGFKWMKMDEVDVSGKKLDVRRKRKKSTSLDYNRCE